MQIVCNKIVKKGVLCVHMNVIAESCFVMICLLDVNMQDCKNRNQ